MSDLLRLLTFQDANTRIVLVGTTLLGIAAAVVGSLAVLRRRSLLGDAVAHAALPGICLAYLVVGERNYPAFMIGALVVGVLAALFVSFVKAGSRVKEDAAIALSIGGFFGIGIVLSQMIQRRPAGNAAGLDVFIFGKAASMVGDDVRWIIGVTAVALGVVVLLYKEFKVLCFDKDFASALGMPAFAIDLALMALVCICTVVGLPAVGVVLVVALLVIPGVAARFWTDRLGPMLIIAGALGGFAGLMGTVLSATVPAPPGALSRGWPTGPLIVLVAALCFVLSLLFAPRRGLTADLARRIALRRRIAIQNLLRDAYEFVEAAGDAGAAWTLNDLDRSAPAPGRLLPRSLRRAQRAGYIESVASGVRSSFRLTPEGASAARAIIRAHRLWELYLIEQAGIAPDHVDRDADQIEHILPPETIRVLEARLEELGSVPDARAGVTPASPHPTPAETALSSRGST